MRTMRITALRATKMRAEGEGGGIPFARAMMSEVPRAYVIFIALPKNLKP